LTRLKVHGLSLKRIFGTHRLAAAGRSIGFFNRTIFKGGDVMPNKLMAGFWKFMIGVPPFLWEKQIEKGRGKIEKGLRFMTADHRKVHHFVVRDLPQHSQPMRPEHIAGALGLTKEGVIQILDDLERHMTFLFRNPAGAVIWAYPVTVEQTPHRITFSTGESTFGA
jgi:hypothetical protein